MKPSILLVDDDANLVAFLRPALREAGYQVHCVASADAAYGILAHEAVDLLLLDIRLPGITGLKLLEILKKDAKTAHLPVVLLTQKGGEFDKIKGLKTGADDYVVKPFSVGELLARMEALLRRVHHGGQTEQVIELGGIRLDFERREVTARDKNVDLTPAEFDLLALMIKQPRRVFSYRILSEALSEGGRIITSGSLYVHIKHLRSKLGPCGKLIETVHGVGYKYAP